MTTFFDGKAFAAEYEDYLKLRVVDLKNKNISPTLVSILVGQDEGGVLYSKLKKNAASRIGVEFSVLSLPFETTASLLISTISKLSQDDNVHGIMLQMPLPSDLKKDLPMILKAIEPAKDVDGLLTKSLFLHPTAMAILKAIRIFSENTNLTCVVVGATGMVGVPLVTNLKDQGYKVIECNTKTENLKVETLKADILVSATGRPNLITADMIKPTAALIDVGYPQGDISIEAKNNSAFATPVPGGIGPVTITCLLENLIEACYNSVS